MGELCIIYNILLLPCFITKKLCEDYKKVTKYWETVSGVQHCMVFLGNKTMPRKVSMIPGKMVGSSFTFIIINFMQKCF